MKRNHELGIIANIHIQYLINEAVESRIDSSFYTWSGDNLVGIEVHNWYYRTSPYVTKYEFQYTDIENPLFYSNIPSFGGISNHFGFSEDVIPNCSRNFPASVAENYNNESVDIYSFESKKFQNYNIPYEVSLTITNKHWTEDYNFINEKQ